MFIKVAKWGLLAPSDIPKSYQIAGLMSLNLMSSYVGHDSLKKKILPNNLILIRTWKMYNRHMRSQIEAICS